MQPPILPLANLAPLQALFVDASTHQMDSPAPGSIAMSIIGADKRATIGAVALLTSRTEGATNYFSFDLMFD